MKRTAFVQKRPPARPATQWTAECMPGPRSVPERVSDGAGRAIVQVPKSAPVRSESYRRFVASFACFDCGISGWSQCAHENVDKGLQTKVCDTRTFPLCVGRFGLMGCHYQFDNYIERTREECRELGRGWVERMQTLARAAGRKEIA